MEAYDVAIVGAGPAGLSLAADLSARHSVVLVERYEIGHTDKAWGVLETDGYRVDDDLVLNRLERGGVRLRSNGRTMDVGGPMAGGEGCALLDEGRVMARWRAKAEGNGCDLRERTTYLGLGYVEGGVELETDKGPIRARLVIDATGYDSPIARRLGLDKEPEYLVPTYGGYVEGASFTDPSYGLVAVRDSSTDVFGEYFPLSPDRGISWVFKAVTPEEFDSKGEDGLLSELREAYAQFTASDPEVARSRLVGERYGVIPMRRMERKAADRVLLVGDAGGQTPFSTLGFNAIFKGHERVADQVSDLLDRDELDASSLDAVEYREPNPLSDALMPVLIRQGIEMPVDEMMGCAEAVERVGGAEAFSDLQVRALDGSIRLEDIEGFIDVYRRLPLRDKARMAWGMAKASPVDAAKAALALGRAYIERWLGGGDGEDTQPYAADEGSPEAA